MTSVLYLFSVMLFPWNGKLEKWWQLLWCCLILCTVVLMQITGINFYCISLYVLFKINQPYLFNLSSEKCFCVLSHSSHLPLDGLLCSDVSGWYSGWGKVTDSSCDIIFSAVSPALFLMHHYILFIWFYSCCTFPRQWCQSWTIREFLSQHQVHFIIPSWYSCSVCCWWYCSFPSPQQYGVKNIILCNCLLESSASLPSYF